MTKLTPEILREAIELVDTDKYPWDYYKMKDVDPPHEDFMIAALASQLISQVNATGEYQVRVDKERTVILRSLTMIWHQFIEGPEPDHNSIIACVEFLRERA